MFFLPGVLSDFLLKAILFSSYMYSFGQHEPGQETDVHDLRGLHLAYTASIKLPEKPPYMLCIAPHLICGNTTAAEMRQTFLPDLMKEPYASDLKNRYSEITVTVNGFPTDSARFMVVDIWGSRCSSDSVRITEQFSGIGQVITITKVAVYKNASWFIYPEKIVEVQNSETGF